jgi:hypothetical protein
MKGGAGHRTGSPFSFAPIGLRSITFKYLSQTGNPTVTGCA